MSVSYSQFDSQLVFGDGEVDVHQKATLVGVSYMVLEQLRLEAAGGVIVDGRLGGSELSVGGLGSLGVTWTLLQAGDWWPWIALSGKFSTSGTRTDGGVRDGDGPADLYALDLRVSLTVGKTLWNFWTLYVGIRGFGGPVFWEVSPETRTGSDRYHYQVPLGSVFTLPGGVGLFVDGSPLGEVSVSAGVSVELGS